jgi:secreted trypsin-like serine protease
MHCKGSCINGNIGYTSLSKAWKKCFEVRHCAFIMRYSDERYYLRRASDNYADGFKGYLHSCDSRDCVEKSNPKSRIGGPDACEVIPHSKPWIAWIEHCGGTLIGSQYVLTAAHCVCKDYYDCNEFIVDYAILGDHDINVVDDGEMKITIAGIIVHPDYKSGKNHNADYAILVLAWPVKTNDRIKIAKLPEKGAKCPPGNNMVVSGWGADTKHELTDKLWSVLQTCLPDEYCPNVEHDRYTLCAGSLKNNANTICGGDSGGPLTYTDYKTGETTLYGVVAQYGDYPNCRKPGVYAPVSEPSVLDWIRTHTDAV